MRKTMSGDGASWTLAKIENAGAYLFGRNSFTQLAAHWSNASDIFAKAMNEVPKIVFSKSGFAASSLPPGAGSWAEARVLSGHLEDEIKELKRSEGNTLVAHGGVSFAQALVRTGLVDEFWLVRHPVAIGHGRALFAGIAAPLDLKLVEVKSFSTGTVAGVYRAL